MKDKIKSYFDLELRAAIVYTVLGVIAGYLSFRAGNPPAGLMAALLIFGAASFLLKKAWNIKKPAKNWVSNGLFFLMIWFITYTIFYNI